MTSKERIITAIHHREPDRVPAFAHLTAEVAVELSTRLGIEAIKVDAFIPDRISYNEILLYLGNDAVGIGPGRDKEFTLTRFDNGEFGDEWGFRYRKVGKYVEIVDRPL